MLGRTKQSVGLKKNQKTKQSAAVGVNITAQPTAKAWVKPHLNPKLNLITTQLH